MPDVHPPTQNPVNEESEKLKEAVANFKSTGQVDFEVLTYVKEKILPKMGFSEQEIENLGPVETMVQLQTQLSKDNNPVPAINLNQEIEELSHKLSSQVDEEIKRQLSQGEFLHQAQGKVDDLLKQNEDIETSQEQPSTAEAVQNYNLNPLQASVEAALENLKEGAKVNDEWSLKRIYTTSFGNNPSPFYELQNSQGAIWTLNQEEMRSLLTQQINTASGPQSYESLQPPSSPTVDINNHPTSLFEEEPLQKKSLSGEGFPKLSEKAPLEPNQIEFLKRLASKPDQWQVLTSITPSQWEEFYTLYKGGKLSTVGIDANPLLDALKNPQIVSTTTIKKGDNIQKLLEEAGFKLSFSAEDAPVLGIHLLINYSLVENSRKKIEATGITVEPLPKEQDLLSLTRKARSGDPQALNIIKDSLTFLPLDGHFKVVKAEKFAQMANLL